MRQKKLWHFGDSFGNACKEEHHHIYKIAQRNDYEYVDCVLTGQSNFIITNYIIKKMRDFQKGDLVYINWSFFNRGEYVDDEMDLKSTGTWYNESDEFFNKGNDNLFFSHRNLILNYHLNFNYDSTVKLFAWLVEPIISHIHNLGVNVVNCFIRKDELSLNGMKFKDGSEINLKYEIKFDDLYFFDYLKSKDWKNEECCHYTNGIQEELSYIIEEKIRKYLDI